MASDPAHRVEVLRTHLELRSGALRPARAPAVPCELAEAHDIGAERYRQLYAAVGARWHWRDRLAWSNEELESYLAAPNVHVWTLHLGAERAGYFELMQHAESLVEIMYFGLDVPFIGQGLGGWMLTRAAEESFALGADRVTLSTCTLDSPRALPNYLARGFTIVREERYAVDLP
jgi:GNAT superfamily N-acetyltransferase